MGKQGEFGGRYKTCERCDSLFYEYPYLVGKKRFCSTSCANKTNGLVQSRTKLEKSRVKFMKEGIFKTRFGHHLYVDWRNKCIARDNSTCQNCFKKLKGKFNIVVHHIKSWDKYPELRLDINNGLTLCRKCHNLLDEDLGKGRYGYF